MRIDTERMRRLAEFDEGAAVDLEREKIRNGKVSNGYSQIPAGLVEISGTVRFVEPFIVKQTTVTALEWYQVMGGDKPSENEEQLPVVNVNWYDSVEFCNALSRKEGLPEAYEIEGNNVRWLPERKGYRLLTESEWEFACRAGTKEDRYWSDPSLPHNGLGEIAWYWDNSNGKVHPVGLKRPNEWQVYDMLGNVWEWCWDRYYPEGSKLQHEDVPEVLRSLLEDFDKVHVLSAEEFQSWKASKKKEIGDLPFQPGMQQHPGCAGSTDKIRSEQQQEHPSKGQQSAGSSEFESEGDSGPFGSSADLGTPWGSYSAKDEDEQATEEECAVSTSESGSGDEFPFGSAGDTTRFSPDTGSDQSAIPQSEERTDTSRMDSESGGDRAPFGFVSSSASGTKTKRGSTIANQCQSANASDHSSDHSTKTIALDSEWGGDSSTFGDRSVGTGSEPGISRSSIAEGRMGLSSGLTGKTTSHLSASEGDSHPFSEPLTEQSGGYLRMETRGQDLASSPSSSGERGAAVLESESEGDRDPFGLTPRSGGVPGATSEQDLERASAPTCKRNSDVLILESESEGEQSPFELTQQREGDPGSASEQDSERASAPTCQRDLGIGISGSEYRGEISPFPSASCAGSASSQVSKIPQGAGQEFPGSFLQQDFAPGDDLPDPTGAEEPGLCAVAAGSALEGSFARRIAPSILRPPATATSEHDSAGDPDPTGAEGSGSSVLATGSIMPGAAGRRIAATARRPSATTSSGSGSAGDEQDPTLPSPEPGSATTTGCPGGEEIQRSNAKAILSTGGPTSPYEFRVVDFFGQRQPLRPEGLAPSRSRQTCSGEFASNVERETTNTRRTTGQTRDSGSGGSRSPFVESSEDAASQISKEISREQKLSSRQSGSTSLCLSGSGCDQFPFASAPEEVRTQPRAIPSHGGSPRGGAATAILVSGSGGDLPDPTGAAEPGSCAVAAGSALEGSFARQNRTSSGVFGADAKNRENAYVYPPCVLPGSGAFLVRDVIQERTSSLGTWSPTRQRADWRNAWLRVERRA